MEPANNSFVRGIALFPALVGDSLLKFESGSQVFGDHYSQTFYC